MQAFTSIGTSKAWLLGILSVSLLITGCDSSDTPDQATVTHAPVAADDTFSVAIGSTTTLDLAANDTDADDGLDLGSMTILTPPANGSVVMNVDGTVTYTHDCSATSSDVFTYRIEDNSASVSNTARVTIALASTNRPIGQLQNYFHKRHCASFDKYL